LYHDFVLLFWLLLLADLSAPVHSLFSFLSGYSYIVSGFLKASMVSRFFKASFVRFCLRL